jgi:hypothetical protein
MSEIALALRKGRPVIGLETWEIRPPGGHIADPGIRRASTADEAVAMAFATLDEATRP